MYAQKQHPQPHMTTVVNALSIPPQKHISHKCFLTSTCSSAWQVWPTVAQDLKTDADGRAVYKSALLSTSAGPLTSKTLKGKPIS